MKAIVTKYRGPGNVRGSRITASDNDGNRVTLSYDPAISSDENHIRAAVALCVKMNWHGTMAQGSLKNCEVFVFNEALDFLVDGILAQMYASCPLGFYKLARELKEARP